MHQRPPRRSVPCPGGAALVCALAASQNPAPGARGSPEPAPAERRGPEPAVPRLGGTGASWVWPFGVRDACQHRGTAGASPSPSPIPLFPPGCGSAEMLPALLRDPRYPGTAACPEPGVAPPSPAPTPNIGSCPTWPMQSHTAPGHIGFFQTWEGNCGLQRLLEGFFFFSLELHRPRL